MIQLRFLLHETRLLRFDDLDAVEIWANPLLCSVVGNGWIYGAKSMLKRGANPNIESRAGQTPLLLAIDRGDIPMTRLLLRHGADADLPAMPLFLGDPFNVATPLQTAVYANNLNAVEVLLEHGVNMEDDLFNDSALQLAVRLRNLDIARLLLHAGATHPDDVVATAVENGDIAMVTLLYEEGFHWPGWQDLDEVEMACDDVVRERIRGVVRLNELQRVLSMAGNLTYLEAFLSTGFVLQVSQIAPYLLPSTIRCIQGWADGERSFYAAFYHGEDADEEGGLRRLTDAPGPISDKLAHFLLPPATSREFLRGSRLW